MKINEQLSTVTSNKTADSSVKSPNNFEHFILSPTGNNSGDEYYWQHQNHLQESSLSFVAKPVHDKPYKLDDLTQINSPLEPVQPTNAVYITQSLLNHNDCEPLYDTDYGTLAEHIEPRQNTCMPAHDMLAFMQANNTFEPHDLSPKHQINHGQSSLSARSILKKHHLFIEEDNAELSINMDGLNKNEQHELTHLITKYLQQKNLKLTQLIINGVNYD